jgi:hypothetical protein
MRDAGGDAEHEVDAEQLAPEAGDVRQISLAGHHVDAFHDDQQERQAKGQRHEARRTKLPYPYIAVDSAHPLIY